jgi:hypothetical protein
MIPRLWTYKELALIAAIVVLACGAAFLSIRLTRPKPFAQATLGVAWQCKQSFLITTCLRIAHVKPVSPQGKSTRLRQA